MNPTTPNKSEGAEWEDELYDLMADKHYCSDLDMGACRKVGHLAVTENQLIAFVAHQRQQAVAEFAREVVAHANEYRQHLEKQEDHDMSLNDYCYSAIHHIRTLLKQRGIDLTN